MVWWDDALKNTVNWGQGAVQQVQQQTQNIVQQVQGAPPVKIAQNVVSTVQKVVTEPVQQTQQQTTQALNNYLAGFNRPATTQPVVTLPKITTFYTPPAGVQQPVQQQQQQQQQPILQNPTSTAFKSDVRNIPAVGGIVGGLDVFTPFGVPSIADAINKVTPQTKLTQQQLDKDVVARLLNPQVVFATRINTDLVTGEQTTERPIFKDIEGYAVENTYGRILPKADTTSQEQWEQNAKRALPVLQLTEMMGYKQPTEAVAAVSKGIYGWARDNPTEVLSTYVEGAAMGAEFGALNRLGKYGEAIALADDSFKYLPQVKKIAKATEFVNTQVIPKAFIAQMGVGELSNTISKSAGKTWQQTIEAAAPGFARTAITMQGMSKGTPIGEKAIESIPKAYNNFKYNVGEFILNRGGPAIDAEVSMKGSGLFNTKTTMPPSGGTESTPYKPIAARTEYQPKIFDIADRIPEIPKVSESPISQPVSKTTLLDKFITKIKDPSTLATVGLGIGTVAISNSVISAQPDNKDNLPLHVGLAALGTTIGAYPVGYTQPKGAFTERPGINPEPIINEGRNVKSPVMTQRPATAEELNVMLKEFYKPINVGSASNPPVPAVEPPRQRALSTKEMNDAWVKSFYPPRNPEPIPASPQQVMKEAVPSVTKELFGLGRTKIEPETPPKLTPEQLSALETKFKQLMGMERPPTTKITNLDVKRAFTGKLPKNIMDFVVDAKLNEYIGDSTNEPKIINEKIGYYNPIGQGLTTRDILYGGRKERLKSASRNSAGEVYIPPQESGEKSVKTRGISIKDSANKIDIHLHPRINAEYPDSAYFSTTDIRDAIKKNVPFTAIAIPTENIMVIAQRPKEGWDKKIQFVAEKGLQSADQRLNDVLFERVVTKFKIEIPKLTGRPVTKEDIIKYINMGTGKLDTTPLTMQEKQMISNVLSVTSKEAWKQIAKEYDIPYKVRNLKGQTRIYDQIVKETKKLPSVVPQSTLLKTTPSPRTTNGVATKELISFGGGVLASVFGKILKPKPTTKPDIWGASPEEWAMWGYPKDAEYQPTVRETIHIRKEPSKDIVRELNPVERLTWDFQQMQRRQRTPQIEILAVGSPGVTQPIWVTKGDRTSVNPDEYNIRGNKDAHPHPTDNISLPSPSEPDFDASLMKSAETHSVISPHKIYVGEFPNTVYADKYQTISAKDTLRHGESTDTHFDFYDRRNAKREMLSQLNTFKRINQFYTDAIRIVGTKYPEFKQKYYDKLKKEIDIATPKKIDDTDMFYDRISIFPQPHPNPDKPINLRMTDMLTKELIKSNKPKGITGLTAPQKEMVNLLRKEETTAYNNYREYYQARAHYRIGGKLYVADINKKDVLANKKFVFKESAQKKNAERDIRQEFIATAPQSPVTRRYNRGIINKFSIPTSIPDIKYINSVPATTKLIRKVERAKSTVSTKLEDIMWDINNKLHPIDWSDIEIPQDYDKVSMAKSAPETPGINFIRVKSPVTLFSQGEKYPVDAVMDPLHPKFNNLMYDASMAVKGERIIAVNPKDNKIVGAVAFHSPVEGIVPAIRKRGLIKAFTEAPKPSYTIDYIASTEHGVGTKLVQGVKEAAKGQGIKKITGHAVPDSPGFWKKMGAEVASEPDKSNELYPFTIGLYGSKRKSKPRIRDFPKYPTYSYSGFGQSTIKAQKKPKVKSIKKQTDKETYGFDGVYAGIKKDVEKKTDKKVDNGYAYTDIYSGTVIGKRQKKTEKTKVKSIISEKSWLDIAFSK